MPSQQQIDANRQNAQSSTGPATPEGKQRSSKNATKHGFTGQSLHLTADEKEPYAAHVKGYFDQFKPFNQATIDLTQDLADARWSIHQIFVQQANYVALINDATRELRESGATALETAAALAPLSKTLQTYSLYEQRRRRAAAAIQSKLEALLADRVAQIEKELPIAAKIYKQHKAHGLTWNPESKGFVCSRPDVEAFLEGQALAGTTPQPMTRDDIRRFEAECDALPDEDAA